MAETDARNATNPATLDVRQVFACECLTDDFISEVSPLLEKHYREISHFHDIALDPDWPIYRMAEANGMYKTYTARLGGKLIGYASFWIKHNAHYKSSLQAVQDVIFIDPTSRGFGSKFIHWCDEQLKALGVQVVRHHLKAAHNWGKILERDGYELEDLIYTKRLDR